MKNMTYRDYVRCIRMMNDMFETPFLLSPIEFAEKINMEMETEEKNDSNVHGYMKTDVYRGGEHVSHEEKELRDGEWVPVKGSSVGCKAEKKSICCKKQEKEEDKDTPDKMVKVSSEIIESLRESNRQLAKENGELKEQLRQTKREMERFADLMENIENSFKKFNEK